MKQKKHTGPEGLVSLSPAVTMTDSRGDSAVCSADCCTDCPHVLTFSELCPFSPPSL